MCPAPSVFYKKNATGSNVPDPLDWYWYANTGTARDEDQAIVDDCDRAKDELDMPRDFKRLGYTNPRRAKPHFPYTSKPLHCQRQLMPAFQLPTLRLPNTN